MAAAAKRPAGSQALLDFSIELLAVGSFTLLAGINNDVGSIMVLIMVGLWLIYMVSDSAVIAKVGNALTNVAKGG